MGRKLTGLAFIVITLAALVVLAGIIASIASPIARDIAAGSVPANPLVVNQLVLDGIESRNPGLLAGILWTLIATWLASVIDCLRITHKKQ